MSDKEKQRINLKSKEVFRAENLFNDGKFEEALILVNNLEAKEDLTDTDQILCLLLKSSVLLRFGNFEDCFKSAEKAYLENQVLGNHLYSIDALLNMAWALVWLGNFEKAYDLTLKSEKILKTLTKISTFEREKRFAYNLFVKACVYYFQANVDQGLDYAKRSLELRQKLAIKHGIVESLYVISSFYVILKDDLDYALEILEECRSLAIEINHPIKDSFIPMNFGVILYMKGDLKEALIYFKKALPIFERNNNINSVGTILNNLGCLYREMGDLDQSLICLKRSLEITKKTGNKWQIGVSLGSIIEALVVKGEIEQAQRYLEQLEEINKQEDNKMIEQIYFLDKALVLKSSPRLHNRVKAEELLKQIIQGEMVSSENTIIALLNLCELLLDELRITGELEILDEIDPLITQLLEIAEKIKSFSVLAETYTLQGQLALVNFDIKGARRLLTQGQQIAEKFGLQLLAMKISNEHDEFLKQLEMWENLKESKASLAERVELARLSDQMESMLHKRAVEPQEIETEQPILLAIISKKGHMAFSNPFTADMTFDVNRIGDFLTSFNTLSDQIFYDSFDRVIFGKYKVLMNAINHFYICYMFHGQTYSAQQKISHFTEIIKKDKYILESLENADNKNLIINVNDSPMLKEIIIESFMSDPQLFRVPFKAYVGDEPFIFVSYSHANKLEVYPILDYLNKTGIKIWYDEGIPVSENWQKSIAENLERCSKFLVFISPHILNSEMVKKEISFALRKKKKFVAVYLKEIKLPTELEFQIADIQALMKYRISESEFYTKLREVLKLI